MRSSSRKSLTDSGNNNDGRERRPWKDVGISYQFDADEMNGTRLMKNLSWIGQTNDILSRVITDDDHDDDDNENKKMMGGGISKEDDSISKHEL